MAVPYGDLVTSTKTVSNDHEERKPSSCSATQNVYAEEVETCLNRSSFVLESLAWKVRGWEQGERCHATMSQPEEFDRDAKEPGPSQEALVESSRTGDPRSSAPFGAL